MARFEVRGCNCEDYPCCGCAGVEVCTGADALEQEAEDALEQEAEDTYWAEEIVDLSELSDEYPDLMDIEFEDRISGGDEY